jgi:hypothetical protein
MKAVVQEKRGVVRCVDVFFSKDFHFMLLYYYSKIRGIKKLFTTGAIEDDFLGQIIIDIKVTE